MKLSTIILAVCFALTPFAGHATPQHRHVIHHVQQAPRYAIPMAATALVPAVKVDDEFRRVVAQSRGLQSRLHRQQLMTLTAARRFDQKRAAAVFQAAAASAAIVVLGAMVGSWQATVRHAGQQGQCDNEAAADARRASWSRLILNGSYGYRGDLILVAVPERGHWTSEF